MGLSKYIILERGSMSKMIVNADDLGMTPGTNSAIFKGFDEGVITHTSIMANADYFDNAIEGLHARRKLGVGMHLNLTYGKSLHPNSLYNNSEGVFHLSYFKLLFLSLNNVFLKSVEKEFEKQIVRVLDRGIFLTHIDSHRHIHLIPGIYRVVVKLAQKYNIDRVRLINENIFDSFILSKRYNFILNGGIVKYVLLRIFSMINARHASFYKNIKFYSILYTGVVTRDIIEKVNKLNVEYEVMVHPGINKLDDKVFFYDSKEEKEYRLSKDREDELNAVLSIDNLSKDIE